MAKDTIIVDLNLDDHDSVANVEEKAKSLKQQLKEMKELLASGTLGKDEFDALARSAGELQDRIGDVNQRVKNLASDSQKLDGFVDIAQGIVGGFAAVQGITALVGDENEELQKTMVKLQATMSALNGIQAIANTLNKDSAALTALQTIRTTALTAAQAAYTFVVGTSTGAMKAFRIALAASGIGLIVIALVAAAEAMGAFGDATDDATEALEKQRDAIEKRNAANRELDNQDIAIEQAKTEVEKARLKAKGATDNQLIDLDIKFLEKKKGFLKQQYEDATGNAEAQEKIYVELAETQKDIVLKGLEKEQNVRDAANKKKEDNEKKHQENLAKIHKEAQEFDERDKKARIDEFQEQQEEKAAQIELEKKQAEERLAVVVQQRDSELALRRSLRERDRQEAEQERKDFEDVWNAKVSIARSGYDILTNLGELALGQQFKNTAAGKALALAQIATDTAIAFIQGLRIAQQSAAGTGPAAAFAFPAFYAAQGAAILGAAAKAKSILSGGSPSGGNISVPNISGTQAPRINTFTPGSSTSDPIKNLRVYVVEKDITDAQGRNARIRDNAEII